jgi:hypothetical protein
MERAMGALAKHRYTAIGEPVAPEGRPRDWNRWLLEIQSAEFDAIYDHVDDGDILGMSQSGRPPTTEFMGSRPKYSFGNTPLSRRS